MYVLTSFGPFPVFTKKILRASLSALFCLMLVMPAAQAVDRKVVVRVKPQYPVLAKRMKISGSVMLTAVVGPSGTVKQVNTIMGEKILLDAARAAVKQWKFAPADAESFEDIELQFPADAAQ